MMQRITLSRNHVGQTARSDPEGETERQSRVRPVWRSIERLGEGALVTAQGFHGVPNTAYLRRSRDDADRPIRFQNRHLNLAQIGHSMLT